MFIHFFFRFHASFNAILEYIKFEWVFLLSDTLIKGRLVVSVNQMLTNVDDLVKSV